MENQYSEETSKLTDEQLIGIVTVYRHSYEPLAIEAAELEIHKRSGDIEKVQEVDRNQNLEKARARQILRLVNFVVDFLAFCLIALILVMIISVIYLPGYPDKEYPSEEEVIGYISLAISFSFYYIILEYFYQKTIGKFLTRTKVVTVSGVPPKLTTVIIRTLCRLIPFDRLSFLFSKNGFHDFLSGTIVVKDR